MKFAITLLRYIKGYALIKITGGFPERFLNLCAMNGICLWDVSRCNGNLMCCINRRDFIKIRSIAIKSGVSITIIRKTGLIYEYRHYSNRIGIATGIIIFLSIHLILNMFVWCIDINGNNTLSKTEILAKSEQYGLREGTFKSSFDEIRAARTIASDYNGRVTWLSINIKGSLAVIELREDNRIIPEIKDSPPCNIVADFDGVILSAETLCGDCTVKKGTGVRKGDMLISGAIINEDMSTTFYSAKGKITALHSKKTNISVPLNKDAYSFRTTDKLYIINIFGLKLPLGFYNNKNNGIIFKDKLTLRINGYSLPFGIEKILICEKVKTEKNVSYITAFENMLNSTYKSHANSKVVEKNEKISLKDNALIMSGEYTLIDFIGEEKPILSEN